MWRIIVYAYFDSVRVSDDAPIVFEGDGGVGNAVDATLQLAVVAQMENLILQGVEECGWV